MDHGDVRFAWVQFPVEFGRYDAGSHGRNGDLLGGTNHVHFGIGELDLSRVHIVDELVAVHEVDADNVVI